MAVSFIFRFISFHSLMPCKGVLDRQLKVYDTANVRVVTRRCECGTLAAQPTLTLDIVRCRGEGGGSDQICTVVAVLT